MRGIDYSTYLKDMENKIQAWETNSLNEHEEKYQITKLNYHRMIRIKNTFQISENLRDILSSILAKQKWLVLSEHWCGDSAQSLPIIAKIADLNNKIHLKIVYRDQNLDLIDSYLTNRTKGIPKLIAFSENGNELFTWGPRPKEASDLFQREKAAGLEKQEILKKLHLWYGRNRGNAIESEFFTILSKFD